MRISMAAIRAVVLVAILPLIAACGNGVTQPEEVVADARARWGRQGPASYTMKISYVCECLPEVATPVTVTVRNGVVTDRRYAGSGAAVSAPYVAQFPNVDGLFTIIEEKLHNSIFVEMSFDQTYGYPTRIGIGNTAADGPIITVSEFQAQ